MAAVVVSGMRPTGRLHLGHYLGTLKQWLKLQRTSRCFFFVADWHALTTGIGSSQDIRENTEEMVADWLAAGLDPQAAVLFRQSDVKQHAELHLLLSMVTPTPWLIRNPTVKEQARELGMIRSDDESEMVKITYGHLGYPVLQAADILMYQATGVPVGVDQVPHVELTRDIARSFNSYFGGVFVEPEPLLAESPKVPGLDGRKMSKSYGNAVFLADSPEQIDAKLSRMMTDPRRVRRNDPGDPDACPAFNLHRIYCSADEIAFVTEGCRSAGIGCLECKKIMIRHVIEELSPLGDARRRWIEKRSLIGEVLREGSEKAREVAEATMRKVRSAMGLARAPAG